jgi:Peroxidase
MRFSSPLAVVVLASTVDAFAWPQGWSSSNWNSGGRSSGTAGSAGGNAPAAGSHVGTDNKVGGSAPQGGFIGQGGGQGGGFTGSPAGFTGVPKAGGNGAQFPTFAGTFHSPAATGSPEAAAPAAAPAAAAPAAAHSGGSTGGAGFGGFTGGNVGGGENLGSCPPVWLQVSQKLGTMFAGCNDAARAAIRAIFHDCFPDGGCDGSIHFPEELSRPENSPMTTTVNALANLANQMGVGVADMLAFAGCKYPHQATCCVTLLISPV